MFNILCLLILAPSIFGITVNEAIRFDKEIKTIEDYKQYLASVRKIYLKQTARRKVTTAGSSLAERDGKETWYYIRLTFFYEGFGFGFHLDFNTFMVQGSGSELARPAACIPELTIVPIEIPDTDSSDLLIPSCTRVERWYWECSNNGSTISTVRCYNTVSCYNNSISCVQVSRLLFSSSSLLSTSGVWASDCECSGSWHHQHDWQVPESLMNLVDWY